MPKRKRLSAARKRNAVRARSSMKIICAKDGTKDLFFDAAEPALVAPNIDVRLANAPLVLHVDDDVDLVDAVTARFGAAGYRVSSAVDGQSGFEAALREPTSAIVLDYDMPNGRGDFVIRELKREPRTRHIPIVVLTAVHEKGLARRLINEGADHFMTKPFDFTELHHTVESLITAG